MAIKRGSRTKAQRVRVGSKSASGRPVFNRGANRAVGQGAYQGRALNKREAESASFSTGSGGAG